MHASVRIASTVSLLALVAACGASGASGGPSAGAGDASANGDTHTFASSDSTGSGDGAGGKPSSVASFAPALSCPSPGPLPFATDTSAFQRPESVKIRSENPVFKYTAEDLIAGGSFQQVLAGTITRGDALGSTPLTGEWVSAYALRDGAWKALGRALTGNGGTYALTLKPEDRFPLGTGAAHVVVEGDGSCATHGVFLWPAGVQVVIADVDGPLTTGDAELFSQLNDVSYDPKRMGAATELLQAWAAKGYLVIYLTARPHDFRTFTRAWLAQHAFPFGPVITADSLVFGDSATAYKLKVLNGFLSGLGWKVAAAYGNATSDIDAYEKAGLNKAITFIVGDHAGDKGTQPIVGNDFSAHIKGFVAKAPVAVQPF